MSDVKTITVEDAKLILGDGFRDVDYQAFVKFIEENKHKEFVMENLLPILHTFRELTPFFDVRLSFKRDFLLGSGFNHFGYDKATSLRDRLIGFNILDYYLSKLPESR